MKAHLVTRPDRAPEIITVERGARELASRDAGGQSKPVDIPDTKIELVPWLNDLAHFAFKEGANSTVFAVPATPREPSGAAGAACPMCLRTPAGAAAAAASLTLTEIEQQIHAANGWQLSNIISAVIGRLGELQREAAKIGEHA